MSLCAAFRSCPFSLSLILVAFFMAEGRPAFAQRYTPFSDADSLDRWMERYYQHPEPMRLGESFTAGMALASGRERKVMPGLMGFHCAALQAHPQGGRSLFGRRLSPRTTPRMTRAGLQILWQVDSAACRKLLLEFGRGSKGAENRKLALKLLDLASAGYGAHPGDQGVDP